jgi:hypothetical protein
MADRADELRATAAQCLALAQSTTDSQVRATLLIMAQKLNDMTSNRPAANFEMAQREFNNQQMAPVQPVRPQPTAQQQQQIQPKDNDEKM